MSIINFNDCRLDRACVRDTVVKGVTIEKGLLVGMPVWQIHRDPEIWEDPETFKPERYGTHTFFFSYMPLPVYTFKT